MSMNASFWHEYQTILVKQKVALKAREWYLRWATTFEKALPYKPLNERTIEDVQTYIDLLVKRNRYQDWQLQQANNALRLLYGECFSLPWAKPWPVVVKNKMSERALLNERRSKKCEFKDVIN